MKESETSWFVIAVATGFFAASSYACSSGENGGQAMGAAGNGGVSGSAGAAPAAGGSAGAGAVGGSAGVGTAGAAGSAVGVVTELVAAEVPSSIAAGPDHVYWTDVSFDGADREAVVLRVPKAGGSAERVSGEIAAISYHGIGVGGSEVYWAGFSRDGLGSVYRAPAAGGDPTVFAPNQDAPLALAVAEARAVWVNLASGTIVSQPLGSGAPSVLASDPQDSSSCLSIAGSEIVWVSKNGDSRIAKVSASGGTDSTLVESEEGGQIGCIATDETHVYFTRAGTSSGDFEPTYNHDGSVQRVQLSGGMPEILAEGQERPFGIAVRGGSVYWHNAADGSVFRVSKQGGAAESIAAPTGSMDAFRTRSMVADEDGVYWLSGRSVWALAIP